MISPLQKARGNAAMAYINERYIYILGGFELSKENIKGTYLNDIEYFDITNFEKGWTTINYVNNKDYNMSLTALGVIPIYKNCFLICGGYDGEDYKNNVYKINCINHEYPLIEETVPLDNKNIFIHNLFCKNKNFYYNYSFYGEIISFDWQNWKFKVINHYI